MPKQVHISTWIYTVLKVALWCSTIFLECAPWFGVHSRLFNSPSKRFNSSWLSAIYFRRNFLCSFPYHHIYASLIFVLIFPAPHTCVVSNSSLRSQPLYNCHWSYKNSTMESRFAFIVISDFYCSIWVCSIHQTKLELTHQFHRGNIDETLHLQNTPGCILLTCTNWFETWK